MSNGTEEPIKPEPLAQTEKKPRTFWNTMSLLFSTIGIIVLIFVVTLSFCRLMTVNRHLASELDALQNTVALNQKQTDESLANLNKARQDSAAAWTIQEAGHFVTLANNTLTLTNDIALAFNLLNLANQEIQPINDAALEPIKRALAADIEKFKAVSLPDVSNLYERLTAANARIEKLPLLAKQNKIEEIQPIDESTDSWWKRSLHAVSQALRHLVLIRHHEAGIIPLITAQEQALFYQTIHALFTQAVWALLHQKSGIYFASLQQIVLSVQTYFDPNSPDTKAILIELNQLQQVDIHPSAPDITSVRAFQDYFAATQKGA